MKLFGVVLLGIGFSVMSMSTNTVDVIYWNESSGLTWEDFEGIPRFDYESISALTSSGIVHYKGCKDGKIIYKVRAYFEKKESWVKDEARTSHHLEHEQIHFDITELNARKLRHALLKREFRCGEEAEFETFVGAFLQNWEADQQGFDMMTRHSMDREEQEKWAIKVQRELEEFEAYREE